MKRLYFKLGLIFMFSLISVSLFAKAKADTFYPDFKSDTDMEKASKGVLVENRGVQFGGWFTPIFMDIRDNDSSSLYTTNTLKIWLKYYFMDNTFFYVRGKDTFSKIVAGTGSKNSSDNLLDLDLAYVKYISDKKKVDLAIGRKHFLIGTGVVLNGRGDGLELNYYSSLIKIKVFGSYTGLLKSDNNPYNIKDGSITYEGKKIFSGALLEKDIDNHSVYMFGVAQFDFADEAVGTKSRYTSQYYGVGAKGIAADALSYYGEFIYEMGKSYKDTSNGNSESDVKAMAALFGMNYYVKHFMKPYLSFQYAYASGDEDRGESNSPIGNKLGDDTGFIGFGTYSGGYALRPEFSNIHVGRIGGGISPLRKSSSSSSYSSVVDNSYFNMIGMNLSF